MEVKLRERLGDVSTWNPFFSITSPSMGGAKVLSMTNLANVSTKNPYFSFTGPSMVNARVFRWGLSLVGPPMGLRRELQLFSIHITLGGIIFSGPLGIIFSGPLWSPYLSLFLSYIWSREKYFN